MMVERGHVFMVSTGRLVWCDHEQMNKIGFDTFEAQIDGAIVLCRKANDADKAQYEKLTWVNGPVYIADCA